MKSPKVYVRDSGLLHALLGIPDLEALLGHPVAGASWEGFVIENLLSAAPPRTLPSFYRTAAGAELDLILEFPGLAQKWALEIKRGLAPKPGKGLHGALADMQADRAFVIYSGTERYPLSAQVEAIGLLEMAQEVMGAGGR